MDRLFSPTDPRRPMPFLSKRYKGGGPVDSLFAASDPRRFSRMDRPELLEERPELYAEGGAVQKGRPWWRYLPWAPQSEEDRIASLEAYAKLEQERARKLQGLKRGGRK